MNNNYTQLPAMNNVYAKILYLFLGAGFVYLGTVAEFPIPGTDIPQTGQTIAVLCVGMLLGATLGGAAVALYLILGIAGLPVFSDGGYGLSHLTGATGGYLWGFVVAACVMGVSTKARSSTNFLFGFISMLLGHLIILICGWLWLANQIGIMDAYQSGVAPFYFGAVAKSIIGVALVRLVRLALSASPVRALTT